MPPPSQFFALMNDLSSLNVDKFKDFEILTTDYKILKPSRGGDVAISTDILIPKSVLGCRGHEHLKVPILIRIHGGFLVTGSSRYAPWFSSWILDYALSNKAVIVSPNYRLLPEVSGADILEDIDAFWNWVHGDGLLQSLHETGHSNIVPDLHRVLLLGESAGGYLAVQLALKHPSKVRGVVAAYPMLDLRAQFYTESYEKPIVGVPNISSSVIDEHLLGIEAGHMPMVATAADPPERLQLAFSIVQNGRFLDFFGDNVPELFPMETLKLLASSGESKIPPFFIFHGKQDSAVPVEGSQRFVSLLRQIFPDAIVRLYVQEGDHGFDADATLDTLWLREGLSMISSAWLNSTSSPSYL